MADLVSIIAGAAGLAIKCAQVAEGLHDLAAKHKRAQITLLSMTQEVETIQAAWSRIEQWSQDSTNAFSVNRELLERLDRSLETGAIVMSALEDDLLAYRGKSESLTFFQRSRLVWNESSLQDHQNRIRGQVAALTLLLQALNL